MVVDNKTKSGVSDVRSHELYLLDTDTMYKVPASDFWEDPRHDETMRKSIFKQRSSLTRKSAFI